MESEEKAKSRTDSARWYLLYDSGSEFTFAKSKTEVKESMGPFKHKADLVKKMRLTPLVDGAYCMAKMSLPITIKTEKVDKCHIEGI
jgi:hypothetical protein